MESEYLQQTVGPVLTDALSKLMEHRMHTGSHPQNPLEFVASYLMQHHASSQTLKQARVEHERIAAIQREVRAESVEVERALNEMREKERVDAETAIEEDRVALEIETARLADEAERKVEDDRVDALRVEEAERDAEKEAELKETMPEEIVAPVDEQANAE